MEAVVLIFCKDITNEIGIAYECASPDKVYELLRDINHISIKKLLFFNETRRQIKGRLFATISHLNRLIPPFLTSPQ